MTSRWSFSTDRTTVPFGGAELATDGGPYPASASGPCTLEQLRRAVAALGQTLQPEDCFWVVIGGHAHFDGRDMWWNLPEQDPNQTALADLFQSWHCRQTVFSVTTAASGLFALPLAGPWRIVICATVPSAELQTTFYLEELANVVAQPPRKADADLDGDGQLSLLDLYLLASRQVSLRFVKDQFVITEHAQMDDNSDGRLTEVQRRFFARELDGVRQEGQSVPEISPGSDGDQARKIRLTRRMDGADSGGDRPPSPRLPGSPTS